MKFLATPTAIIAAFGLGAISTHFPQASSSANNKELQEMYNIDQSSRQGEISELDWEKLAITDLAHQKRVAEMLQQDLVTTSTDYYNAAMIFQHASTPQGYKMAHELSMISASLGNKNAKWLAAASWDRFLGSLKLNQRFGTQYYSKNGSNKFELGPVDPEVTDYMRKALNCPTLQQAKKRAKDF